MRRKDTQPDSEGRRETRGLEVPIADGGKACRSTGVCGGRGLPQGATLSFAGLWEVTLLCGQNERVSGLWFGAAGPSWALVAVRMLAGACEGACERPCHVLPSGSESSST